MKLAGKTVLLTGAGSGMGRELALLMVLGGARVIGCDIRAEGLAGTRDLLPPENRPAFASRVLDVADRAAVAALPDALGEPVDCLINCAGMIQPFVRFAELDPAVMERVLAVNWTATLDMTRAFLPGLLARPAAQLVNFGSMSSIAPLPGQAIYGATKAAIKLFTETLWSEYRGTGLQVTLILPGAVATNISANSGLAPPIAPPQSAPAEPDNPPRQRNVMNAADAAAVIYAGIEAGEYRVLVDQMMVEIDALYRRDPQTAAETIAANFAGLLS